jgi:8-oxo-dGTP pyrophosphatase MutT (NUDIX family)
MTKLEFYNAQYASYKDGYEWPYGIGAGGVVYKHVSGKYYFLLLGRDEDGDLSYHLPKGTLHLDETLELCALREIKEEAGVNVMLKTFLGAKYTEFEYKNKKYNKTLLYFAAKYIDEAGIMDNEHDFKQWFGYDQAIEKLFKNPKQEDEFILRCNNYLMKNMHI